MRYHSVVASKREINFARQFFRSSLFIMSVQQKLAGPLGKCFRSEIALNSSPMANGNPAGLFRDHDRDRVRFFGDPKRGAMAQAQTAVQRFALAHWKNTSRGGDPAIANNHSAVVECGLRMEDA